MLGQRISKLALERPVDVKFGPDGSLYILDMGRMEVKNGKEHVSAATGQIFRLVPVRQPAPPATQASGETPDGANGGDAPTPTPPGH
jgi:sugar lactone lactonase YvrE